MGRPCAPRPALGDSYRSDAEGGRWSSTILSNRRSGNHYVLYALRRRNVIVARRRALDSAAASDGLPRRWPSFDRVDGSTSLQRWSGSRVSTIVRRTCRVSRQQSSGPVDFPDDTFDLVVSSIVLQHIEPAVATRFLRELCRVLAPAGAFVCEPARRRAARITAARRAGSPNLARARRSLPRVAHRGGRTNCLSAARNSDHTRCRTRQRKRVRVVAHGVRHHPCR